MNSAIFFSAPVVEPLPGTYAGIVVRLDGDSPQDRTPEEDPGTKPLSAGKSNFNFYSLEVVQRIGYDSYTPDHGVLIAKNMDRESRNGGVNGFNCFNWVIDARLQNALTGIKADESATVSVFVIPDATGDPSAVLTLKAVSESDPSKSATAECLIEGYHTPEPAPKGAPIPQ